MPQGWTKSRLLYPFNRLIKGHWGRYCIDKPWTDGINRFTEGAHILREGTVGYQQHQAFEGRNASRGRDAESLPRKSHRSKVSRRRVLRSTGRCTGQVRNVASRVCGRCLYYRRCQGVRGIKANILSGQGKSEQSGHCRIGAEKAGSSSASQTPQGYPGVYREPGGSRRADSSAAVIYCNSTEIQGQASPTNDRAGTGRKKNAAVKCESLGMAVPAVHIAAQYERLRTAAQGSALPPEARSGLSLFLRRGMWGWARAMTSDFTPTAHSSFSSPPPRHAALVQIFASMALNLNNRRPR